MLLKARGFSLISARLRGHDQANEKAAPQPRGRFFPSRALADHNTDAMVTAALTNHDSMMAVAFPHHDSVTMTPAMMPAVVAVLLDDDGLRTGGGARRRQREAEGSQSSK
jgi:hypothetical protein